MTSKLWLVVAVLVGAYFLLVRKNTTIAIGATSAGTGAAIPNAAYATPKPAIPQPSTAQVALAAGIKEAPAFITALGSLFSSDDDVDTSYDD